MKFGGTNVACDWLWLLGRIALVLYVATPSRIPERTEPLGHLSWLPTPHR